MREDKVLKQIHKTQKQLRSRNKGLSWEEEARVIEGVAKKAAQKYHYRIFPVQREK